MENRGVKRIRHQGLVINAEEKEILQPTCNGTRRIRVKKGKKRGERLVSYEIIKGRVPCMLVRATGEAKV